MKMKKPNPSGYAFANMFKNINDEHKWVARLKKIAKEQHRSVSGQARVFLMKAIVGYESKK
jgi:hypothetical protein